MRAHGKRFVLAAFATLLVAPVAGAQDFVPGQVIVKYSSNKAAGEAAAAAIGATTIQTLDAIGAVVLSVGDVDGAVSALAASGGVEYAEPNYLLQASVVPNDPLYGSLWGMARIDAPLAWDVNTGDPSVIVAVIDTGIDYNHPDLAANVWTNPGEIAGNGIDDDANGVIDDVHGFNAITGSGNPLDDNNFPVPTYHGTHVSGTIGAVGNNAVGVVGVNWTTTIMGCKFLNSAGSGTTVDAIECINYTVDNGATVLNNSWGGGGFSQALADAIDYADQNGVLFVAASGNSTLDTDCSPEYPAAYDNANIISVASTTSSDGLSSFSNYGRTRSDLGAPGSGILSTLGNSTGYHSLSGTSMATPHVAGAAALTWAANPGFSHMDVKARLLASVERIASLVDRTLTFGILNVNNAVNGIIPDLDGDGIPTGVDNCPDHDNPAQTDTDGDGIGDDCDTDAPCPPGGGCGIVTVETRPGDGMSRALAGGLLVGIAGAVVIAGRRRRA